MEMWLVYVRRVIVVWIDGKNSVPLRDTPKTEPATAFGNRLPLFDWRPILQCLGYMMDFDITGRFEIGDRAAKFQYTVITARA